MGLFSYLKGVIGKLFGKQEISAALGERIEVSQAMADGIVLWSQLYANAPPWESDTVQPINLPAIVAAKVAKLVTLECEITVSGSPRADYLASQLQPIKDKLRALTEYAVAKGGLAFKPYLDGNRIAVDCVHANHFYPTAFDGSGNITAAAFFTTKVIGQSYYTRVESHAYADGVYTIHNRAFRSGSEGVLGAPVALTSVEGWEDLQERMSIAGVDRPLFAYFKMPFANNIDPASPLGVSAYARASGTFKDIDEQYAELLWEFRGGELAIHAAEELLQNVDGKSLMPAHVKRLYRKMEADAKAENFYEVFAPQFRDASLLNGFNALLRQAEMQCGLSFGTLSDVQAVEKTATETIHAKQDSYTTVSDIQKALQVALEHLLYAVDTWVTIGKCAPSGTYEVAYYWDDSIIVDKEAKKQQFWQYVVAGKFPFWKFLVEFEGYTEEDAKALATEEPPDLFAGDA